MFDADKTRVIGLPYGVKIMTMLSRFHMIPERYGQTVRQTDGRTDRIAISRVSVLTRYKNAYMDLDEMLRVDRCRDMDELINF